MRLQTSTQGPSLTDNSNRKLGTLDYGLNEKIHISATDPISTLSSDNNRNDSITDNIRNCEKWELVTGWEDNRIPVEHGWYCESDRIRLASDKNNHFDQITQLQKFGLNHPAEELLDNDYRIDDLIKGTSEEPFENFERLDNRPDNCESADCAECESICSGCSISGSDECNSSCDEESEREGEEEDSDDSFSEPELAALPGFVNPNYPGFQHLAHTLPGLYQVNSDSEEEQELQAELDCTRLNPSPSPLPSPCDTCLRIDKIERELNFSKEERFKNSLTEEEYTVYLEDNIDLDYEKENPENEEQISEIQESDNIEDTFVASDFSNTSDCTDKENSCKSSAEDTQDLIVSIDSNRLAESENQQISKNITITVQKEEEEGTDELVESSTDKNTLLNPLDRTVPNSPAMEPAYRELNIPPVSGQMKEINSTPTPVDSMAWEPLVPKHRKDWEFKSRQRQTDHAFRKREKTEINNHVKKMSTPTNRPKRSPNESKGDPYRIDSVMPEIDLDAIENHLRAAREEERRRRNDREEIRRRLATGDQDDYPPPGRKKPSLQSRLQSGMNLQICFMNDSMSDSESPSTGGNDGPPKSLPAMSTTSSTISRSPLHQPAPSVSPHHQPRSLNISLQPPNGESGNIEDFSACCMRLQAEARLALAQSKDIARAHMQRDRRRFTTSPITDMLRNSLSKVGVALAEGRRRVSRQLLTDMNVAQLQVIVNDLHSQIELLNEGLVKYLMERDELHMSQDSMLVDIEDLTRYLGAKESIMKEEMAQNNNNYNSAHPSEKKSRITSQIAGSN